MNRLQSITFRFFLILMLLGSCFFTAAAQELSSEYIPVHTEEELRTLFSQVKSYLDSNGESILQNVNETENQVITQALIRSWAIVQYENADPRQIDDAYDALFNMSLFMGLATDPGESFSSGLLFEYAVQLLDQEYFDLLAESGEDLENVEYAEYLRGVAEGLVETPEAFSEEEVEDYLFEIYQETYLAAGLKAISHTEALPLPEELFPEKPQPAMVPNPMKEYYSVSPLNEMLGIEMPELPESFGAELGYYSIIADVVAEIKYDFPDGGKLILRLSPQSGADISGVYGAEFYKDWKIAGTEVEVSKYQSMLVASGTLQTMDGSVYAYAVDSDGLSEEQFYQIVRYFIEECRNRKVMK